MSTAELVLLGINVVAFIGNARFALHNDEARKRNVAMAKKNSETADTNLKNAQAELDRVRKGAS